MLFKLGAGVLSVLLNAPLSAQTAGESAATTNALNYVRQAGEAWMQQRGCVSCHQVPSMIWSHEAVLRGDEGVPSAELEEWENWSTKIVNFVKPAQKADCEVEETMASNIDTMVALLLAIPNKPGSPWRDQFVKKLIAEQADDGSWKACGQLPLQRRPPGETGAVTTLWTVLALSAEGASFNCDAAIQFADSIPQAKSVEWFAARLLVADALGQDEVGRWTERLIDLQNEDGGWGWRVGESSDALGTGYALYALAKTDSNRSEPQTKARVFLMATQNEQGSWTVPGTKPSANGKPTKTATDWGTAWAVIALSQGR